MAVSRSINRLLIDVFWPWFREHIWPLIREEVLSLLKPLIHDLRQSAAEWVAGWSHRENEARSHVERANEATKHAEAAGDTAEAHAQRRIADVWRNVADSLREENEALKSRLEDLTNRADQVVKEIERGVDLRPSVGRLGFVFAGRQRFLLPPSTPLRCPKCGAEVLNGD